MTPFILKGIKGEIIALNRLDGPLFPPFGLRGLGGRGTLAAVWAEPAFHLLVPPAQLSPILFVPDSILFLQSYPIPLPLHQILSASVDKWRVFPDYLSHSSHTQLHSEPKPVPVSIRKGWSRLLHVYLPMQTG